MILVITGRSMSIQLALACVASVPVRAERERAFSHSGRAKSRARAKRSKEGGPHFCSRLTSRAAELPSPHFSRGPNAKKLFRLVRFHSGTLATQAKFAWDPRYKFS